MSGNHLALQLVILFLSAGCIPGADAVNVTSRQFLISKKALTAEFMSTIIISKTNGKNTYHLLLNIVKSGGHQLERFKLIF